MITKIYTDLEQSRKLAEFLPLESADMHYARIEDDDEMRDWTVYLSPIPKICALYVENLPCWSLSALLAQMPCVELISSQDNKYRVFWKDRFSEWQDNPVDACVELIERVRKEEEKEPMTIEEAIKHCEEKACNNTECGREHKQLAEWLKELNQWREDYTNPKIGKATLCLENQGIIDRLDSIFNLLNERLPIRLVPFTDTYPRPTEPWYNRTVTIVGKEEKQ